MQQFKKTTKVQLEQDGCRLTWYIPAVMGDGQTEDVWYPYVFFHADENGNGEPGGRDLVFKGLRPAADGDKECWLVHARKLKKGDQVYFTPATFDFEWLDTAASRFEIAYDEQGRRCSRANRPYLLDELDEIKEAWELISRSGGLTTSQVHALREVIESHREEWQASPQDETFQQLSRDAVRNAKWKGKPSDAAMDKLANWAASGLLTDVIELCMGIMKEKPSRDERAGETP